MRARFSAAFVLSLGLGLASTGCAELGVVSDATTISYGRPNSGKLIDGVKLPDSGPGYLTPPTWKERGNRYGTNELVGLIKGVAKRLKRRNAARLVVADLSSNRGGEAHAFHRSHQNGRDVDLIYFERDADGKTIEPDVMRVFDANLVAKDGSGVTVDVPRTWALVRELLTADEAYVQYIFMYKPIAERLIEHATKIQEPEVLLARAAKALRQPGDSAPHNDHMHVRVYCAENDRRFGCVDIGPLELLAERETEARERAEMIASTLTPVKTPTDTDDASAASASDASDDVHTAAASIGASAGAPGARSAADVWGQSATSSAASLLPSASTVQSLVEPVRAPR